jgi:hypothetical protein
VPWASSNCTTLVRCSTEPVVPSTMTSQASVWLLMKKTL